MRRDSGPPTFPPLHEWALAHPCPAPWRDEREPGRRHGPLGEAS